MIRVSKPRRSAVLIIAACVGSLIACGGDTTASPSLSAGVEGKNQFWELRLNHRSVTLSTAAPYDTVTLTGIPLDAFGNVVPQVLLDGAVTVVRPTPRFANDTNFTISASGVVRALHPERGMSLMVTTSVGGITRSDTVLLDITTTTSPPPRFASIDLQLTPSDTLGRSYLTIYPVAQALDTSGNIIDSVPFAFYITRKDSLVRLDLSSNPVNISNGSLGAGFGGGGGHGRVMLYATATVYGIQRTDSIPIIVPYPNSLTIGMLTKTPRGDTVKVGYFRNPIDSMVPGDVVWGWPLPGAIPTDVTFDDPSAAEEATGSPYGLFCGPDALGHGNIPAFAPDTVPPCFNSYRVRRFTRPGTYHYHSEVSGASGTLVVLPEGSI